MFKDKEDAVKVRKKAEGVLFGEFLEYYESELKENHEAEVEELKQKYEGNPGVCGAAEERRSL